MNHKLYAAVALYSPLNVLGLLAIESPEIMLGNGWEPRFAEAKTTQLVDPCMDNPPQRCRVFGGSRGLKVRVGRLQAPREGPIETFGLNSKGTRGWA